MTNRAVIMKTLSNVRHSYWFVPASLAIAFGAFAFTLLWVDGLGLPLERWLPASFIDTQPVGARTTLSVIAQSVIGVTGVMFSVTMVAVSFASGNFGPRLIGNFMRDRGNRWSLGILISTFVYALIVLNGVQEATGNGTDAFVPHLSLLIATGMAFVAVFVMIYFVHHVPETINVSNIVADLGKRFSTMLVNEAYNQHDVVSRKVTDASDGLDLRTAGYVQRIDIEQLDEIAQDNDLDLHVIAAPGIFVHESQKAVLVSGTRDDDCDQKLRSCFALGPSKTEEQNLLFIAEQLVEMIARALSPGINDPFTAINCMNWCAAGIAAAASNGECFGVQGRGRVSVLPTNFSTLLHTTFGAAYPYAKDDKLALERWNALLDELETVEGGKLADAVDECRKIVS